MIKNRVLFIFAFFVLLMMVPLSVEAQSEKIINGGFETGSLAPWEYVGAGITPPVWIISGTQAYQGSYSMRIGGYTLCIVRQEFSEAITPISNLSFWVLVPSVVDPCVDPDICTPGFALSIKYIDSQVDSNLVGQLSGSGWKKIDIPVNLSKKILSITFTTAEISDLYIDEVSLLGTSNFPWPMFQPAINGNTQN